MQNSEEVKLEDLTKDEKEKLEQFCFDFVIKIRPDQGYFLYDVEKRLEDLSLVEQHLICRDCYVLTEKGARLVFEHFCKDKDKKAFADRFKEVFGESIYAEDLQDARSEAEKVYNDEVCEFSCNDGWLETGCGRLMKTVANYEKLPESYPKVCPFCKKKTVRKLKQVETEQEVAVECLPEVDMVNRMKDLKSEGLTEKEIEKLALFGHDFLKRERRRQGYTLWDEETRLEDLGLVEQSRNYGGCYVLTEKGARFIFERICKSENMPAFADSFRGAFCKDIYADEENFKYETAQGTKNKDDKVNSPSHYTGGDIECIDAIRASMTHEEFLGYLKGCSMKYLWRYQDKGGVEDLDKARWYLKRLKKAYKKYLKREKNPAVLIVGNNDWDELELTAVGKDSLHIRAAHAGVYVFNRKLPVEAITLSLALTHDSNFVEEYLQKHLGDDEDVKKLLAKIERLNNND